MTASRRRPRSAHPLEAPGRRRGGALRHYVRPAERFGLVHPTSGLATCSSTARRVRVIDFDDCGRLVQYDFATTLVLRITARPEAARRLAGRLPLRGRRSTPPNEAELDTFVCCAGCCSWPGSVAPTFATEAAERGAGFTSGTSGWPMVGLSATLR